MRQALRIGSRGSPLALVQAELIRSLIKAKFPEIKIELHIIRTTGDKILDSPLSKIGGKGVFVKEIEDALVREEIDIAVHSMKDLPASLPRGLAIGAVAKRHDPRDALVSSSDVKFHELPKGAKVGTSSLRRQAQLLHLRSDIQIVPIRGNVDTRLRRVRSEGLDSAVLALAGLERMGFKNEVTEIFPVDVLLPAPGQGILAVECREDDIEINEILSQINHKDSSISGFSERAFLSTLGGGCQVPVGCYARIKEERINIMGLIASPDGGEIIKEEIEGSLEIHESLGKELALRILNEGGRDILSRLVS
jgi:hydroxymethylbilane synthase